MLIKILALVCCAVLSTQAYGYRASLVVKSGTPNTRYIAYPWAWKNGQVTWYYNAAAQPAWLNKDTALAAIAQGMRQWQAACNVTFTYAGEITAPAVLQDNVSTLGWGNTQGIPFANFWANDGTYINEGDIQFVAASYYGRVDYLTANVIHEVGHMIGLSHSDRPESVMFANGYNTFTYQTTLKGDDIAACAKLYGGRGLIERTDYQTLPTQPIDGYRFSFEISRTLPSNTPVTSLTTIAADVRDKVYFKLNFDGVPVGETLTLRFVTPDGSIYDSYAYTTEYPSPSWFYYSYDLSQAPMRNLTGNWEVQAMKGERILARQKFAVAAAYAIPAVPNIALIYSPAARADSRLEVRNLQAGTSIVSQRWLVNGRSIGSSNSIAAGNLASGNNSVTLFATSNHPRYANTEATMPDGIVRLNAQLDDNGWPLANRYAADIVGDRAAATLDAQLALRASGTQGIYLAILTGGKLLFKTEAGWQDELLPLMHVTAPAAVALNVLDRFDLRTLPSGTTFFAGFGTDIADLLAKNQYGVLYSVP